MTPKKRQAAAVETVVQAGAAADLPTSPRTCPYCDTAGQCQQLPDHPTIENPPIPYGCGACGAEFAA